MQPVTDVRAFLAQRGTIRRRPHSFTERALHWPYCAHCGLLLLNNEVTRRWAAKVCEVEE